MPTNIRCSSRLHTVRLRDDRLWKRALCPKCKTAIDPTRLRRLWAVLRDTLAKRRGSTEIPDEIRFANLRWRLDRLIVAAWTSDENIELNLNPRDLDGLDVSQIIRVFLSHINRVAPGLPVPIKLPKISASRLQNAGGTFGSKDGWAILTLSKDLINDEKAVRAVLAHEVCHYVLNCAEMREADNQSNEKLTDLCMFALGLGEIYLAGYKSAKVQGEYRIGHRLGYLTDAEYGFARRYVLKSRSDPKHWSESSVDLLRAKISARVGDSRAVNRLIESERRRSPDKTELEIYKAAFEGLEKGRT